MRISRLSLVLSAAALVAVSACNGGGTASPSSSAPTSSAAKVANPLNTDKLKADLCKGLTAAQLQPYTGVIASSKLESEGADSSGCTFHPKNVDSINVGINYFPKLGPADLKAAKAGFPWNEDTTPIDGYYTRHASQAKDQKSGACGTAVAVNDTTSVEVLAQTSNEADPNYAQMCTVSDKLAKQLIENLKAGN
ncbi:DUF3558 domain-containing protein [Pseudonocardiaceae bacterium YIM PH 21723]|nr:DUF3558 domain-containing protein [Pseudonocardiaceae bacterium YIM PH 21723]